MRALQSVTMLMFIGIAIAQSYVWPTNASHTITTVFGDARPRRFHAGLDIRTWGKTGYELYAIEDGYIQRIRTGSRGYGKTLYVKLNDGNIAVYAHLENFTMPLNKAVRSLQEAAKSYTIDHYFLPDEYPVKRGNVIGYSGDTGTISGAHLHFEIRDKNENPVNPQLLGLTVEDTSFPEFFHLGLIPLSFYTKIDHSPVHSTYFAQKVDKHHFSILDTITIQGPAGFAVEVKDKLNNQPFNYGLFSIELEIDSTLWFQREYDTYSFREEPLSVWDMDYTLNKITDEKYYRLFQEPSVDVQNFVKHWNSETLPIVEGVYHFRIKATDFTGNTATLTGIFKIEPQQKYDIELADLSILKSDISQSLSSVSIYQLNHGLVLETDNEPEWGSFLEVKASDGRHTIPVFLIPNNYYGRSFSRLLDPIELDGLTSVTSLVNGIPSERPITGRYVRPDSPFILVTPDSSVVLSGTDDCFYYPALVWTSPVSNRYSIPEGYVQFGPIVVGPDLIPYKNEMELKIRKQIDDKTNSAIYYFDPKKSRWLYMNTTDDGEYLSTTLLSGGVFAVLSESDPPVLENIFPSNHAVYESSDIDRISFNVNDAFSGIDGERNVSIILDGKPLIFEYNSYRKRVSYTFWDGLPSGKHQLEIRAADNIGNSIETIQIFTIR